MSDPLGLVGDTTVNGEHYNDAKTLDPVFIYIPGKGKSSSSTEATPSAGTAEFTGGRNPFGSSGDEARSVPFVVGLSQATGKEIAKETLKKQGISWLRVGGTAAATVTLTISPLTAGEGSDTRLHETFQKINTRVPSPVQEPEGIQYTLRARADGFYPVYDWGSKGTAVSGIWLKKGEIWKIGTTINGVDRYNAPYYNNIGKGLVFVQEYPYPFGTAPMDQVLFVEKMKLINYVMSNDGNLPPGNTKFQ